jgi:hypothetical protein
MRDKSSLFSHKIFWPAVVSLASFSAYLATLPRTTSFEDSAEFVTAAATWGIPHASGYPLHVVLAGLFAKLPFGTVPWRVALFSAVCASAALALAFVLARRTAKLLGHEFGALGEAFAAMSILSVGFTEIWWGQAVYAKVYSLHALLLLGISYAVVRAADRIGGIFWPVAAAAVFGLSCSNHLYLSLAAAPFLLAGLLLADSSIVRPSKRWPIMIGAFIVGMAPTLYLVLRASSAPYSMETLSAPSDFLGFFLRRRYGDVGSGGNNMSLALGPLWEAAAQVGPFVVALAALGAIALMRLKRRGAAVVACLAGLMFSAPLALLMRSIDWLPEHAYVVRVYGLPAFMAFAVLAGLGVAWLGGRGMAPKGSMVKFAAAVMFALLPLSSLAVGYGATAPYRDPFPYDYAKEMLSRLPSGAVLVVCDYSVNQDTILFNLAYLQLVERFRTDVTVVQDAIDRPFYRPRLPDGYGEFALNIMRRLMLESALADTSLSGRPLFTTFPSECAISSSRSVGDGIVFRPLSSGEPFEPARPVPPPLPEFASAERQVGLGLITSKALYSYSAALADAEGDKAAVGHLVEAIKLDTIPMGPDYRCVMAHRATIRF